MDVTHHEFPRAELENNQDSALAAALDDWDDEDDLSAEQQEDLAPYGSIGDQDSPSPTPDHAAMTPARKASDKHARKDACSLLTLPHELQLRVWAFLSAVDLCVVARTCTALRSLSGEQVLWRRLYCARWGKPQEQQGEATWKALYHIKDAEDRTRWSVPEGVEDSIAALYGDMQRARREQALGRGKVDDTMEVPRCALQERLEAWRREHPPVPPGQLPQTHPHTTVKSRVESSQGCGSTPSNPLTTHKLTLHPARPHSKLNQENRSATPALDPEQPADSGPRVPGACSPAQTPTEMTMQTPMQCEPAAWSRRPCGVSHGLQSMQKQVHSSCQSKEQQQQQSRPQQEQIVSPTDQPLPASTGQKRCISWVSPSGRSTAALGRSGSASGSRPRARRAARPGSNSTGGKATISRTWDDGQQAARPDLDGPQGRNAYTWDKIGDYYCCRETGWIHLCDQTCREGVIDPAHDLVVCPISCRTVDRMVTDWELHMAQSHRDGPIGHDEQDADFAGFVGRAYERGYSCRNPRELERRCGVKLG